MKTIYRLKEQNDIENQNDKNDKNEQEGDPKCTDNQLLFIGLIILPYSTYFLFTDIVPNIIKYHHCRNPLYIHYQENICTIYRHAFLPLAYVYVITFVIVMVMYCYLFYKFIFGQ